MAEPPPSLCATAYIPGNAYAIDSEVSINFYNFRCFVDPCTAVINGTETRVIGIDGTTEWRRINDCFTSSPTSAPSIGPTPAPTKAPTNAPTNAPTSAPIKAPTNAPSIIPTKLPTAIPSVKPSTTSLSTPGPTYPLWSGGGCPGEFSPSASYEAGEIVTVDGIVYECLSSGGPVTFCGNGGYEPGSGLHWTSAWELMGSCTGTITPTSSPVYSFPAWSGVGCPEPFDDNVVYDAGDRVSWNGLALECKQYPASQFCNLEYHAPGDLYQQLAWNILGTCKGTIAPSASPIHDGLSSGGCPEPYAAGTSSYTAGTRVEKNGLIYECKKDAYSAFCPYASYAPYSSNGVLAWNKIGWCEGTISPTSSPSHDGLSLGGCPKSYIAGTSSYTAGTRVEYNGLIYECKNDANSAYCPYSDYAPGSTYGSMAWNKIGWCDGTTSPTSSPTIPEGNSDDCFNVYVAGNSSYTLGTRVQYNGDIYECTNTVYYSLCSDAGYGPDTVFGYLYWNVVGSCSR